MAGGGASASSSPRSSDNESISDAFPQAVRQGSAVEALRQSPGIEVARRGSLGSASAERGGGRDAGSAGRGTPGAIAASVEACGRSSGGPLTVDHTVAEQLESARRLAAERRFSEAVRACLRVLVGPDQAIEVLHDVCSSLQASASEDALALKEALSEAEASQGVWRLLEEREAALEEEVRGREGAERRASEHLRLLKQLRMELRAQKDLLQAKEAQIAAEMRRREAAVREATDLRLRCALHESTARENALLRQRLREAAALAPSFEGIARRVAELECGPLRQCSQQGRQALKRRILIKWHPDKQPSADHAALATQVMQELQNLPEWEQESRSASLGR